MQTVFQQLKTLNLNLGPSHCKTGIMLTTQLPPPEQDSHICEWEYVNCFFNLVLERGRTIFGQG